MTIPPYLQNRRVTMSDADKQVAVACLLYNTVNVDLDNFFLALFYRDSIPVCLRMRDLLNRPNSVLTMQAWGLLSDMLLPGVNPDDPHAPTKFDEPNPRGLINWSSTDVRVEADGEVAFLSKRDIWGNTHSSNVLPVWKAAMAWMDEGRVERIYRRKISEVQTAPIPTETDVQIHHGGLDHVTGIAVDVQLHSMDNVWNPHELRDTKDRSKTHILHSAAAAKVFLRGVSEKNRRAHNAKQSAMKKYKALQDAYALVDSPISAEGRAAYNKLKFFDIEREIESFVNTPEVLVPVSVEDLRTWAWERILDGLTRLLSLYGGPFAPAYAGNYITARLPTDQATLGLRVDVLKRALADLDEDSQAAIDLRLAFVEEIRLLSDGIEKTVIPEPAPPDAS